jgi:hypothetical protein
VITGAQIKAARRLVGWPPSRLAQKARVVRAIIELAEKADGEPPLTIQHMKAIRAALEAAGIDFMDGDAPGVRLGRIGRHERPEPRGDPSSVPPASPPAPRRPLRAMPP